MLPGNRSSLRCTDPAFSLHKSKILQETNSNIPSDNSATHFRIGGSHFLASPGFIRLMTLTVMSTILLDVYLKFWLFVISSLRPTLVLYYRISLLNQKCCKSLS